jgi:hypothetical protein
MKHLMDGTLPSINQVLRANKQPEIVPAAKEVPKPTLVP